MRLESGSEKREERDGSLADAGEIRLDLREPTLDTERGHSSGSLVSSRRLRDGGMSCPNSMSKVATREANVS